MYKIKCLSKECFHLDSDGNCLIHSSESGEGCIMNTCDDFADQNLMEEMELQK